MIYFRQLYDESSSTYTYLLGDMTQHKAVLIDPVREHVALYLCLLDEQALKLCSVLETHVHADHITGAALLREQTGAQTVVSVHGGAHCADVHLQGDEVLHFGTENITTLATPGHTPGCTSYVWRDRLFSGDTLLIGGCGRTDFQAGDAGVLYDSITHKIWTLPGETLVYPAHDYHHLHVSSVAQERESNARLAGKSRDEFIAIMSNLNLPRPRLIDQAVPANQLCGQEEPHAA
jgi:glyoxylase-like metal-dependent hydrolase (beta-lactamase superfamily II)